MAGWLGANFSSQLDQLKKGVSQVSTIVKDTLVVDETWDREVDENGDSMDKVAVEKDKAGLPDENLSKEQYLEAECKRLDNLYRVSIIII